MTVPSDPSAKLMYYIDCICTVLPVHEAVPEISKYRQYQKYYLLNQNQKEELIIICALLNPKVLLGKCIFLAPELCINNSN